MILNTILIILAASFVPVIISYVVEILRKAPLEPEKLAWAKNIPVQHIDIDGITLRYIKTGQGEPLLLLHTLRTQLDMFQKMIPSLSEQFTVYALDYPGHGYSDIPIAEYTPQFFLKFVEEFLDKLNLQNVTVVGESIGGSLGLMLAAKNNSRIKQVVSVNPYDYGKGFGIARGSWVGALLLYMSNIPLLGATNWRLRVFPAFLHIMRGGVYDSSVLSNDLMHEINDVGNRPYHYRSFMSLIRHFPKWELEKENYHEIQTPVLLVYGDHDWSTENERLDTKNRIDNVRLETITDGGHFLSLEKPDKLTSLISDFTETTIDESYSVPSIPVNKVGPMDINIFS
ncbi:MAG: alpha/beta hydrolase [Gammaproteobacteria bacterium]